MAYDTDTTHTTLRDRLVEPTPPRRVKSYKVETPVLLMPRSIVDLQPVGYETPARRHGADGAIRMSFRNPPRQDSGITIDRERATLWLYEDEWYANSCRLDEKRFLALLVEWHKPAFVEREGTSTWRFISDAPEAFG